MSEQYYSNDIAPAVYVPPAPAEVLPLVDGVPVPGVIPSVPSSPLPTTPGFSDKIVTLEDEVAILRTQVDILLAAGSGGGGGGVVPRYSCNFYMEGSLVAGKNSSGTYTYSDSRTIVRIDGDLREVSANGSVVFEIYKNAVATGITLTIAEGVYTGQASISLAVVENDVITLRCTSVGVDFPGAGCFITTYWR